MGSFPLQKTPELGTSLSGQEGNSSTAALRNRPREVDPPGHFVPIRGHVANVEANELTKAKSGTQGKGQKGQIPPVSACADNLEQADFFGLAQGPGLLGSEEHGPPMFPLGRGRSR